MFEAVQSSSEHNLCITVRLFVIAVALINLKSQHHMKAMKVGEPEALAILDSLPIIFIALKLPLNRIFFELKH